ncbi:MAG: TIGR01212 family radical SAM protein [Bacteroidales bacterium]
MTQSIPHNYPWNHSRPFNSYANHIRNTFGTRIQKISLHGNFTCPNRDGTKGYGGCAFCNNDAFITSYCTPEKNIAQQIEEGKKFVHKRYKKATQYFAYFQAYSNTYTTIERLEELIAEIKQFPEIIGCIIGTRPDCIDTEKLDFFEKLHKKNFYVVLEYGVESVYDNTLTLINRGHTFACSEHAIRETAKRNIPTGAHIILGLPGETKQHMIESAGIISKLPLTSIKLHQLQIVTHTRFAREYLQNPTQFSLFTPDTYIAFVAEYLTYLSPTIMIERLASETPRRVRIAPIWEGVKYETFVQMLEKYMITNNLWQGKNFIHLQ